MIEPVLKFVSPEQNQFPSKSPARPLIISEITNKHFSKSKREVANFVGFPIIHHEAH